MAWQTWLLAPALGVAAAHNAAGSGGKEAGAARRSRRRAAAGCGHGLRELGGGGRGARPSLCPGAACRWERWWPLLSQQQPSVEAALLHLPLGAVMATSYRDGTLRLGQCGGSGSPGQLDLP